jgi:hypothetical protein
LEYDNNRVFGHREGAYVARSWELRRRRSSDACSRQHCSDQHYISVLTVVRAIL